MIEEKSIEFFNFSGKDENDLTRMFALMLNYNRNSLKLFLESIGIKNVNLDDVKIKTQDEVENGIYDIVIICENNIKVIIEAKLESITCDTDQLFTYSENLSKEKGDYLIVKLVYLTKYDQTNIYQDLKKKSPLLDEEIAYCRWMKKFENTESIYDTLRKAGNDPLPVSIYNDFLDYMEYLAQPDDFFIGQIKDRQQWDKLFSDQSYEFEFQKDCKPSRGAEYFLPYRMKTVFEREDIQAGIDHCAKITYFEVENNKFKIGFEKPKRLLKKIEVEGYKLPCGYTDLITLKKALVRGTVDNEYPLRDSKNNNWEKIEIPGEWKDCPIEKLLIE